MFVARRATFYRSAVQAHLSIRSEEKSQTRLNFINFRDYRTSRKLSTVTCVQNARLQAPLRHKVVHVLPCHMIAVQWRFVVK